MAIKYFGIKTPENKMYDSYVWWISDSKYKSWDMFFQFPGKRGEVNYHRAPMHDAIKAYEAIGYKCIELKVEEKEKTFEDIEGEKI